MPVNPTGLAIEGVAGGPGLQDGRAALKVSGMERNVETHPRDAAPLRISLLDKGGHKLVSQTTTPPSGAIQPGETRPFTLSFLDPPLQAASFQVEFRLRRHGGQQAQGRAAPCRCAPRPAPAFGSPQAQRRSAGPHTPTHASQGRYALAGVLALRPAASRRQAAWLRC